MVLRIFFYLDHRTVDGRHNIIIDLYVIPGNTTDDAPYVKRIYIIIDKFKFAIKYVVTDEGYSTTPTIKHLKAQVYITEEKKL